MADDGTRVCHQCFGDEFLKKAIRRKGAKDECSFCGKNLVTLSLEEVADLFETAIATHYERTPSGPSDIEQAMINEGLRDWWYPDGEAIGDVLKEIGECNGEVAEAIRDVLDTRHSTKEDYEMGITTEFDSEAHYEASAVSGGELGEEWPVFEKNLKTKSRYMSVAALKTLDKIFQGIETHRTYQNNPVIVAAGPGTALTSLFRARVFQSEESCVAALERPEISIGPPPPKVAAAGAMNARGIPVFYGATDRNVALAEVRPPVGSKVVVAQFDIIRPLRLLDVEALRSLSVGGSPFDPQYMARKQKASFLSDLSEQITKPVMPEDETLNYIPTQAIAEYLASLENPQLDGMMYPSVQAGDDTRNVVLFNKAAIVAKVERPTDVAFEVRDYENYEGGPEIEYSVKEEFDSEYVAPKPKEPTLEQMLAEMNAEVEDREPALQLSETNVWVHHIKKVSIESDDYRVTRNRWDKKSYREFEKTQTAQPADLDLRDPIEI
jgi:RES domain/HEPN/RES N-terminal domain 1